MTKQKILQKMIMVLPLVFLAVVIVAIFSPHAQAATWFEPLWKTLKNTDSGIGQVVATVWQSCMALVNSLVLIALVYVAFMNILRVQMDSYAVKKILPTFIMAVILANFSFLISRILVDFASVICGYLLLGGKENGVTGAFDKLINDTPPDINLQAPADTSYAGAILAYIVKQILVMVGSVFIFILSFIFLVRDYMVYFLVAIAPIGFMAMVLPLTKKYFQMWWSNFSKWVFMPVVSVFWLWLAGQFFGAVKDFDIWIAPYGFGVLCFYMAITSPFKIGGAVVGAWAGLGKKAWAKTGGQVTGAAKAGFTQRYERQKMRLANKAMATPLGKRYERYKAKQVFLSQQPQDVRAKAQEDAQKVVYLQAYHNHVTGKKKMNDAEYSRVVARNRKWIGDEQETVRHHPAEGMYEELKSMKAIDETTGYLKDEKELSKLKPDDYLKIKAIAKELREQQRRPITREEAEKVWWKIVKPGKIRTAQVQDIARDLYDEKLNFPDPEMPEHVAEARGITPGTTSSAVPGVARAAGQPLPAPTGPGGRESIGDIRRRQQATAGGGGQTPAAEEAGEARPAEMDFAGIESRLDNIAEKLGQNPDTLAASIAKAMQSAKQLAPDNIGLGLAAVPELNVRITKVDPQARTDFLRVFNAAGKHSAAAERQLLERNEQIIRNLKQIGEQGNAQQVLNLSDEGEREVEGGE